MNGLKKMNASWWIGIAAVCLLAVSCAQPREGEVAAGPETAPGAQAASVHAKQQAAPAPSGPKTLSVEELYRSEPPKLTVLECARCHSPIFHKLKDKGGKHRFECTNCHTKFHTYNPLRKNWAEIMPKCSRCHKEPHGPKHTDCLNCHTEPHTPRVVAFSDYLGRSCQNCHTSEAGQLKRFESAHTEQGCTGCHESEKHGFIPSCFNCHEPHVEGQTVDQCKACHPAHKPLQVSFENKDVAKAQVCSACHDTEYDKWSHTKSKHGQVQCVRCHTKHGEIPQCQRCHGIPHSKGFMAKFPKCLDCHLDVHNLPVKG